jgi:hypothetical protein
MAVRIGTSGWSYDHWHPELYPPGLPPYGRLGRHAGVFPTAELNGSFYRWLHGPDHDHLYAGSYPDADLNWCILANGPQSFAGRKTGILVTSGADAGALAALRSAAESEGASTEIVAPVAGGVDASGRTVLTGRQIDASLEPAYEAGTLSTTHCSAITCTCRFLTDSAMT